MEKEVRIKIISKISDPAENGDCEKFDVSVPGRLSVNDGAVCIDYEEGTEGLEGVKTRFFFTLDRPGRVSMRRRGNVCLDLVFDCTAGSSNFTYQNGIMPFEGSLVTDRLINSIGSGGGTLHIDYRLGLGGEYTRRTVFNMSVRPI